MTISYRKRGAAPAATGSPGGKLTEAAGAVAEAPDGVTVAMSGTGPYAGRKLRFTPGEATRRGDYLLVRLTAASAEREKVVAVFDYLRQGRDPGRSGVSFSDPYDASGVHLLDARNVTLPLSYDVSRYDHACLCDNNLATVLRPGGERELRIWFPAPAADVREVTVDVPGKLRITGIPVT